MKKLIPHLKKFQHEFPELVGLLIMIPILILTPLLLQLSGVEWLFNYVNDNPSEPNRMLLYFQAVIMTINSLFIANFAAYGAIKYNNRMLWEYYISEDLYEESCENDLKFYWWRYFGCAVILLSVNTYLMIMM